jgi:Ca2+-binding EF-hand superfamily protein
VFHLCDVDGDGFLNYDEMQRFARQKGFDGTEAEWMEEYDMLCREVNVDPAKGIDVLILERLANDASSCGCYCTDGELRAMRARLEQADKAKLEAPFPTTGLIKEEAPAVVKPVSLQDMPVAEEGVNAALRSRTDLVREVFAVCDADGDGRLTCWEMRRFADWTGFQGDAQAWNNEYRLLCADHKADPSAGVDLTLFTEIVSDDSDSGCYCTNSELQSMLAQWRQEELGRALAT